VWSESRVKRKGSDWGGLALGANSQRCSPTRRLLTAAVLFFLVLQFCRFYLGASADRHLCPEQSPDDVAGMHAGHNHHEDPEIPSPNPAGGPYFQHCKDHVYSLGLTSVQPLAEPIALSLPWTPSVAVAWLPILLTFPQNDLTTPFHPPRHLS
jgi:hypothetical protein